MSPHHGFTEGTFGTAEAEGSFKRNFGVETGQQSPRSLTVR